jgi:uncharacterized protein (TIGR02246 family)
MSPPLESSDTAAEQAVRNVIARWHRATAAGDVQTVLGLMADDALFLSAGQAPMSGRAAFERGLRQLLASHSIESSFDVHEVVAQGDLAYARADLEVRAIPRAGGPAATRRGSALSIFRRGADGAWRLTRDANLLGPASP